MEVGTTTTGEPGTDAAVEIEKTGTKYTANFTIPRGDKGEQASVAHDNTLTGDGTTNMPLMVAKGTAINPVDKGWADIDFDEVNRNGFYSFNGIPINGPSDHWSTGILIVSRSYQLIMQLCVFDPSPYANSNFVYRYARTVTNDGPATSPWSKWRYVPCMSDVLKLGQRIAALEEKSNELAVMQTQLQALETRINSLENNK